MSYPFKYRLLQQPAKARPSPVTLLSYPFKYRLLQPYAIRKGDVIEISCHTRSNTGFYNFIFALAITVELVVIPVQIQASTTYIIPDVNE